MASSAHKTKSIWNISKSTIIGETLLVPNWLKTVKSKGNLQTKYKVNVHHAYPTTEPCAANKLYIQQRLEATKRTESFTSIIT